MQIDENILTGPVVVLPGGEVTAKSRVVRKLAARPQRRSAVLATSSSSRPKAAGEEMVWAVLALSSAAALLLSLWI